MGLGINMVSPQYQPSAIFLERSRLLFMPPHHLPANFQPLPPPPQWLYNFFHHLPLPLLLRFVLLKSQPPQYSKLYSHNMDYVKFLAFPL